MKHWIIAAMPFVLAAVLGAAWHEETAAAADNTPQYTVTIPMSVSLGETALLSADASGLAQEQCIRVWLTGTGEPDDAFRLHSATHSLTYSVTQDGQPVGVGSTILQVKNGSAPVTAELAFGLPEVSPFPGEYTGTVQFTVSAGGEESHAASVPAVGYVNASAGVTAVSVGLYNPEDNPCSFLYEITLRDTEEVLYRSEAPVVPGMRLDTIELTHPLDAGNYPAILKVQLVSLDGDELLNSSLHGFELRVR